MARKKAAPKQNPEIFLAVPMYGGQCTGVFVQSLLALSGLLSSQGVKLHCAFMFNESLITRARNNLAHQFLEGNCTHLLFIDADMKFQAEDIYRMLLADKDIIVAICPKKEINWGTVREAAYRNEQDLSKFTGSFVVNLLQNTAAISVPQDQPFPIAAGGTGVMLIKREVFNKLDKHTPTFRNDMSHMTAGKPVKQFFTESIDPDSGRLLSEDYHFCHAYRKVGGSVWGAPWCKIGHFGTYLFEGQLVQTPEPSNAPPDWENILNKNLKRRTVKRIAAPISKGAKSGSNSGNARRSTTRVRGKNA